MTTIRKFVLFVSAVFFGALILLVGCCCSSGAPRGKYGPRITSFSQLLCPPSDLYTPILSEPLDLRQSGTYRFSLQHQYPGGYQVSLVLAFMKVPEVFDKSVCDVDMDIELSGGERLPIHGTITRESRLDCFWGPSYGGIVLFRYSVPEDVPADTPIKCLITVNAPSLKMIERYGPATVQVTKSSVE